MKHHTSWPNYEGTQRCASPPTWDAPSSTQQDRGATGTLKSVDQAEAAEKMIQLLPKDATQALNTNLNLLGGFDLGAMCSGTDIYAGACMVVFKTACKELGMPVVHVRLAFSCEIKPSEQRDLLGFADPDHLFADVGELQEGMCDGIKSSSRKIVPTTKAVVAGFSCTDVSHLHKDHAHAKNVRGGQIEAHKANIRRHPQLHRQ